jgi:hypothetical protein
MDTGWVQYALRHPFLVLNMNTPKSPTGRRGQAAGFRGSYPGSPRDWPSRLRVFVVSLSVPIRKCRYTTPNQARNRFLLHHSLPLFRCYLTGMPQRGSRKLHVKVYFSSMRGHEADRELCFVKFCTGGRLITS